MEVGFCAAVDFIAREQVNGVGARGVGGEFGSKIGNGGDGAGGEFALGVAFADDNFWSRLTFEV